MLAIGWSSVCERRNRRGRELQEEEEEEGDVSALSCSRYVSTVLVETMQSNVLQSLTERTVYDSLGEQLAPTSSTNCSYIWLHVSKGRDVHLEGAP